ncbi:hypothetical protein [Desulfonema magnum]|uniref:hypothetical protein n=1 Tax=Desulfonema magnum TaxID=45655 RepID=UPI001A9AAC36|nr:hypothetical protein [Desulfonema magnum]
MCLFHIRLETLTVGSPNDTGTSLPGFCHFKIIRDHDNVSQHIGAVTDDID